MPNWFTEIFDTIHRPSSLYVSTYENFPEDQDDWNCDNWKIYYTRNKAIIGQQSALQLVQTDVSNLNPYADVWVCKYDCDFVEFFENEGLPTGGIAGDLACTTGAVVTGVKDLATGLGSGIKMASVLIPVGVGIGAIYLLSQLDKKK